MQAQRYNRRWPPVDLLNTAALLRREGFEVSLFDARAMGGDPALFLRQAVRADRVLVTTSPLDRWQCPNLDLAPLLDWTGGVAPEKLIVSGVHGTLFPEAVMKLTGAPVLMRGEPEASAVALFRAISKGTGLEGVSSLSFRSSGAGIVHTGYASPADFAAFPAPAYDLAPSAHYEYELMGDRFAVLETSRGCPGRCLYCLKTMYGHKIRKKTAARVAAELEMIVSLGYRSVYFIDLEFSLDRERTLEICKVLRAFRLKWCCQTRLDSVDPELLFEMKKAGCALIHYGIESGNEEVRRKIGKPFSTHLIEQSVAWTKAAGIAVAGFFLAGFPFEPESSWKDTEELAKKLNLTYASFHLVTAYAGTGLTAGLPQVPWWEQPCADSGMQKRLRDLYLRYYLRPGYFAELFRSRAVSGTAARLFAHTLRGLCRID